MSIIPLSNGVGSQPPQHYSYPYETTPLSSLCLLSALSHQQGPIPVSHDLISLSDRINNLTKYDFEAKDKNGNTLLHLALLHKYSPFPPLLIAMNKRKASFWILNNQGFSPFDIACQKKHPQNADRVLTANIEQTKSVLSLAPLFLHQAMKRIKNHINPLLKVLDISFLGNIDPDTGESLLHLAIRLKALTMVKILMSKNPLLAEYQDINGNTPLMEIIPNADQSELKRDKSILHQIIDKLDSIAPLIRKNSYGINPIIFIHRDKQEHPENNFLHLRIMSIVKKSLKLDFDECTNKKITSLFTSALIEDEAKFNSILEYLPISHLLDFWKKNEVAILGLIEDYPIFAERFFYKIFSSQQFTSAEITLNMILSSLDIACAKNHNRLMIGLLGLIPNYIVMSIVKKNSKIVTSKIPYTSDEYLRLLLSSCDQNFLFCYRDEQSHSILDLLIQHGRHEIISYLACFNALADTFEAPEITSATLHDVASQNRFETCSNPSASSLDEINSTFKMESDPESPEEQLSLYTSSSNIDSNLALPPIYE